nr:MAG TPA: hypothetical protein [Caudoviricetes sp.]
MNIKYSTKTILNQLINNIIIFQNITRLTGLHHIREI